MADRHGPLMPDQHGPQRDASEEAEGEAFVDRHGPLKDESNEGDGEAFVDRHGPLKDGSNEGDGEAFVDRHGPMKDESNEGGEAFTDSGSSQGFDTGFGQIQESAVSSYQSTGTQVPDSNDLGQNTSPAVDDADVDGGSTFQDMDDGGTVG